jgi:hypothetical protein
MSEDNLTPWQRYKKNLGETRPWDMLDRNAYTTEEKAAERYAMCLACPELIKVTKQCKKCGCFMVAKTKLEHASCPLGKW